MDVVTRVISDAAGACVCRGRRPAGNPACRPAWSAAAAHPNQPPSRETFRAAFSPPTLSPPRSEAVARPRPSVRTFQRRRRTLGAVVIFGLASGLISTGAFASDPAPADQIIPRSVVAQSGDTLWDIARTIAPTGDISELVRELVRANGARIEAGQIVRLP